MVQTTLKPTHTPNYFTQPISGAHTKYHGQQPRHNSKRARNLVWKASLAARAVSIVLIGKRTRGGL